jgi:hypothetical protein
MPSIHTYTMDDMRRLCGWREDKAEVAYAALAHRFTALPVKAAPVNPGPPIWKWAKQAFGGKHFPNVPQEIGDCVSHGAKHAVDYLYAFDIACNRKEEKLRLAYPPYIYGTSRIDIGKGELGSDDGSTGAWAVEAMRKCGILFDDDAGVQPYSGSIAKQWGTRGVPQQFKDLAKDNPVKEASKVTTVDEIRTALLNYRPCTFAIAWDYANDAKEKNGYRTLYKTRYVGGHQVCLLHWIDEPFEAAYLDNSWGDDFAQGPAPLDEPPGGGWVLRKDLERDLSRGQTEVYALSCFVGDPGEPWYGMFGRGE